MEKEHISTEKLIEDIIRTLFRIDDGFYSSGEFTTERLAVWEVRSALLELAQNLRRTPVQYGANNSKELILACINEYNKFNTDVWRTYTGGLSRGELFVDHIFSKLEANSSDNEQTK